MINIMVDTMADTEVLQCEQCGAKKAKHNVKRRVVKGTLRTLCEKCFNRLRNK